MNVMLLTVPSLPALPNNKCNLYSAFLTPKVALQLQKQTGGFPIHIFQFKYGPQERFYLGHGL